MEIDSLPMVSIIVVNYNGRRFLEDFFNSILNMDYPKDRYEIIFADNGSSDESIEYVLKRFHDYIRGDKKPLIRIVRFDKNLGFALANNIVVHFAKGEYLAFINNDVIVDRSWLRNLVRCVTEEGGQKVICGSRMLWYKKPTVIIYNGGRMTVFGITLHEDLYKSILDESVNNERHETFYADGCGFIVSREDFLSLGGFNISHFAYAEDYELCWRAWLAGFKVLVEPHAYFWHKISGTFGEYNPLKVYLLWRNLMYNIFELAHPLILPVMFVLVVLYGFIYNCIFSIVVINNKRGRLIGLRVCRAYLKVLSGVRDIIKRARRSREKLVGIYGDKFYSENLKLLKEKKILGILDSIREFVSISRRRKLVRIG